MESSDPGEEVYEPEGLGHSVKLLPTCHFLWEASSSERHASLIQPGVIFGPQMTDKKSRENLASLLVSYLAAHPRSSARQVSTALGVEKSRVNSVLYGRRSVFVPEGGSPPQWSVAVVGQAAGSESQATPSSANFEEPVVSQSASLSEIGLAQYQPTALKKEVEELVWQFPGISYGELALLTGSSEVEVRSAAKRVRYLIIDDSESDDADEPSVNDRNVELLGVIRTAGTMEFPLSSDGYDDLLRRGFIKGVTSVRIGQIFGSWRRACEIAGVEAPKAARSNYESRWTDHELAEAVARFLTVSEYRGAHHRYDEWRTHTGNDDDTPSSGTLRNRLGPGWKAVRRRGLDILRERWLVAEERWLVDGEAERGLE